MGLFGKIKKSMGVGTISFELVVPAQVDGNAGKIAGQILLKAKSEQQVKDVEVVFERIYSWEERESYHNSSTNGSDYRWVDRSNTVELGKFVDKTEFALATDEERTIPFEIAFQPIQGQATSDASDMLWNVLDSALFNGNSIFGSSTRNQRIEYKVLGDVNLEGVAFDKGDTKTVVVM